MTFIVGLFGNRYCRFFADQCNIIGSFRYSLHTSTSANKNEVIITEKALLSLAKTSLPDSSVSYHQQITQHCIHVIWYFYWIDCSVFTILLSSKHVCIYLLFIEQLITKTCIQNSWANTVQYHFSIKQMQCLLRSSL